MPPDPKPPHYALVADSNGSTPTECREPSPFGSVPKLRRSIVAQDPTSTAPWAVFVTTVSLSTYGGRPPVLNVLFTVWTTVSI